MNRPLGAALTLAVLVLAVMLLLVAPQLGGPPTWVAMMFVAALALARILEY